MTASPSGQAEGIVPRMLALFQRRIEGDDALLRLAQLRFREAGLGPEYYAESPEELAWLLGFRPSPGAPAAVHLPRGIDIFQRSGRQYVVDFVRRFRGEVGAFILHDQPEAESRLEDYVSAVHEVDRGLLAADGGPCLFIEYAAHIGRGAFVELFRRIRDARGVSACVDTGHVGLKKAAEHFSERHPGEDLFRLSPDRLGAVIGQVQEAAAAALPALLGMTRELCAIGKPLHFHLHDGHPLLRSPAGLSDHFSFLERVPIPCEWMGRRDVDPMYGPSGLREIAAAALRGLGPGRIVFSLEIHESAGRLPLGEAAFLFERWTDTTNAERMNHWLRTIVENHALLREACGAS
jgi:hypothetical protein